MASIWRLLPQFGNRNRKESSTKPNPIRKPRDLECVHVAATQPEHQCPNTPPGPGRPIKSRHRPRPAGRGPDGGNGGVSWVARALGGAVFIPTALTAKTKIKSRFPPGSGPEAAQKHRFPQEHDNLVLPPDPPGGGETRTK